MYGRALILCPSVNSSHFVEKHSRFFRSSRIYTVLDWQYNYYHLSGVYVSGHASVTESVKWKDCVHPCLRVCTTLKRLTLRCLATIRFNRWFPSGALALSAVTKLFFRPCLIRRTVLMTLAARRTFVRPSEKSPFANLEFILWLLGASQWRFVLWLGVRRKDSYLAFPLRAVSDVDSRIKFCWQCYSQETIQWFVVGFCTRASRHQRFAGAPLVRVIMCRPIPVFAWGRRSWRSWRINCSRTKRRHWCEVVTIGAFYWCLRYLRIWKLISFSCRCVRCGALSWGSVASSKCFGCASYFARIHCHYQRRSRTGMVRFLIQRTSRWILPSWRRSLQTYKSRVVVSTFLVSRTC